ncbi:uncharacterized protein NDAI_0B06330 [Naumovozyma dairenensis CBS 421]|uniref:Uncharacterized protein n=1 Tax=Naumovozyma dairenensis (strain ATCC 10597 / BCRC 20456 / CBS 421 / NBRC 0211 / NRRL Y-12639) TaxID=1071378 RepID=G0W7A3_NAUDC|nr:hypothetical protein NDAI_0B06330 [Naumovozyma dairenensis CBS 421]CCD23664.1 hypothetical protein NDAI_0B06330 [Naumovozyma dairenensis CBS 421]
MSVFSDSDSETEVVSRNLCAIVDIGSNGIRFSISSKAAHHARIMPCVFKDRVGISLYEIQYSEDSSLEKRPIPHDIIVEICAAMKRFKLICEDFGVSESSVRVLATESTREAINCQEFIDAIHEATNWGVELLSSEEEGRITAYGVMSSYNTVNGLYMDLGGSTTQLSWIKCKGGEIAHSATPVALPYGAWTLTKRLKLENINDLFLEIKNAYTNAIQKIGVPDQMFEDAEKKGGFYLIVRGGGFRGLGHLILSQTIEYPIQTIINGFSSPNEEFTSMSDFLFLKGKVPPRSALTIDNNSSSNSSSTIFKVSERRAKQLPAVGLFLSAAFDSLPHVKSIYFSEGGVREGTIYSILPREIRGQDPLIIATRPYAPLLAEKYLQLLRTALPDSQIPKIISERIAPALCNLAFVHASYPKELQPTAALHIATRGIIAGCHGLSHLVRALVGIALCNRWGGNIPYQEEKYVRALEDLVLREGNKIEAQRIIWWTKYIGTIMYVICGVHPGGNIRDDVFDFYIMHTKKLKHDFRDLTIDEALLSSSPKALSQSNLNGTFINNRNVREFEVVVRISKDDLKTSASVRSRIITLQKKVRKLSRGSSEKVKIGVQFKD